MIEGKIIYALNEKKAFKSRKITFQSRLRLKDFGLMKGVVNPTYCVAPLNPHGYAFLPYLFLDLNQNSLKY